MSGQRTNVVLFLLGMAVICAAQLTAQAANIYVDGLLGADCLTGNYSIAGRNCSGADGNAYNTVQEAVDVVNAGDTIHVREGTYAERVKMTRSGTAADRWTLRNYGSEEVWIDGEYHSSNQRMYAIHVQASYINIVGINCKRTTRQGIYGFLGKHITVSDLTIRSCNGAGIGLYGEEISGGSDDWAISNVKSYNNGTGLHAGTKAGHSGGNVTITDCEFTDNCGRGVTARYDGVSASFTPQAIPDRNYQTDLFAASDSTIWICGFGGYIIKTVNSGATWTQQTVPTREVCLSGIWGSSTTNVFAVGAHGVIWHYDGGSWTEMSGGTMRHLYAVHGASGSAVWAVGWTGTILKYDGASWSAQSSGTMNHLRCIWAVDANTAFAVGNGGKILRTTNGGTNWSSLFSGTAQNLYAIAGADANTLWAVGAGDTILKTTNGGTNWTPQTSPTSGRTLISITVADANTIWVGGASKDAQTLISTSDGGSTWIDQSGLIVWQTMGWPNNDVYVNGIAVHSTGEVTIAGAEWNENSDGVALTRSHGAVTLERCKLNRNGDDGFDVYNSNYAEAVADCQFLDNDPINELSGDGNGIKVGVGAFSNAVVRRSVIARNASKGLDSSPARGTAIMEHVTVYNNYEGIAGATTVRNVISWGQMNRDMLLTAGGTYSNIIYATGSIIGGTNIWMTNPLFTDADNYDFTLTASSPAVDTGLDWGQPYLGAAPDLGAFESPHGPATVRGRYVFYNNSAFDGNDSAANAADDAGIAIDKSALLPGGTATFVNYTSYGRGINGIMIDIKGLIAAPSAADFEFKVGNDNSPGGWSAGGAPSSITVRAGAGVDGADRITLIWADNAIEKQWLEVTVKATANTGLASPDVFYFGNAIGETGNLPIDAEVTPADEVVVRNNPHTLGVNPATITEVCDFNRDRKVGPTDQIICRNNGTSGPTALQLITVP